MRLWSIHPKLLDSKGLVALWREALLAKAVLEGKTIGYKNHPQLSRFKESNDPLAYMNKYLEYIHKESIIRGYNFDGNKIDTVSFPSKLTVTDKQIYYELSHLLKKLKTRDNSLYISLKSIKDIDPHPLFKIIKGEVEDWEVISQK